MFFDSLVLFFIGRMELILVDMGKMVREEGIRS